MALAFLRPGGAQALVRSPVQRLVCTSWARPPTRGTPSPTPSKHRLPRRRAAPQLGGRIERSLVRRSAGPRPGVPGGRASWAPGRPQNGRRVSPSFVFRSHKRPGACHGRLRPTAWRPGRCRCQEGLAAPRVSKGADLPPLPGVPGFIPPAPLPPARIQAASGPAARESGPGQGPPGSWHREERKRKSVSAGAPGPETSRNAERPPWRSSPELVALGRQGSANRCHLSPFQTHPRAAAPSRGRPGRRVPGKHL